MDQSYSIVRDVDGWRVIFNDEAIDCRNFDRPQHRSEEAAHRWAKEILALEASGRRHLATGQ